MVCCNIDVCCIVTWCDGAVCVIPRCVVLCCVDLYCILLLRIMLYCVVFVCMMVGCVMLGWVALRCVAHVGVYVVGCRVGFLCCMWYTVLCGVVFYLFTILCIMVGCVVVWWRVMHDVTCDGPVCHIVLSCGVAQ